MTPMNEPFVVCENLVKIYKVADLEVVALQGVDLTIAAGEMMALVGPSGSGKSTLMNILGALDTPSAGQVHVGDYNLLDLTRRQQVAYRRNVVGFVWQQTARNLLPYLTAQENVELPMALNRTPKAARRARARELLAAVGLDHRFDHKPAQLSGGEQQRVAIAIAVANSPSLLLADEPTGEVDSQAATLIFDAMRLFNRDLGVTILIVTHDHQVAGRVDRVIGMLDGRASTEILRTRDAAGATLTEDEYVLLDRAGRIQLPKTYIDALEMKDRVRLSLHLDHVQVYPQLPESEGEQ
ncbi:MAG: ABC transporter ATP-binding protein [Chloroflexi bacterium]|nr:ABC transporter ATP-binding protein [Chloroflexota bacterium]